MLYSLNQARQSPPGRNFLLTLLLASSLSGCAATQGFLVPVNGTVPSATQVEMVVATTRRKAEDRGILFSGARADEAAFADIIVSIPPDRSRQIGEVQWPAELPGNPATDFVTLRADIIQRKEAEALFHKLVLRSPRRQALVFVHGFNNRFEDAVYRFAQFVHDSRAEAAPVLFTWPSRGSILAYGYDRESASYSRDALERLLAWLSKNPSVDEITVLAHSMGNWVTLEALRQMAIRNGKVPAKIKNVMLAAADVDFDIARDQIATMGPDRPHITLLVSRDDRALAVSQKVWGGTRLGGIDPTKEPYKSALAKERVSIVNLTGVSSPDQLQHGTFAESPKVVELIGQSLATGQTLTDSREGLGDKIIETATGAASSVGRAASVVVTAPVAIIDPVTREHYDEHLEALGSSLHGTIPR